MNKFLDFCVKDYVITDLFVLQLSDQIDLLFESLRISEAGARVRFAVAAHLENSIKTYFPNGCVVPFGSSVSGIGQNSGDLDLVLLPEQVCILCLIIHCMLELV